MIHSPSPPKRCRVSRAQIARRSPIIVIGDGRSGFAPANAWRRRWAVDRRLRASIKSVTPLSSAISPSLRLAGRSNAWAWPSNSSTTAPIWGQARMSAAADSASSALAARSRSRFFGVAAQFQKSRGRERAIFHRRIVRPDPEQAAFSPSARMARQAAKPLAPQSPREDFMLGAGPQTAAQHGIGVGQAQRNRGPVMGQAIAARKWRKSASFSCLFMLCSRLLSPAPESSAAIESDPAMLRRNWYLWRMCAKSAGTPDFRLSHGSGRVWVGLN